MFQYKEYWVFYVALFVTTLILSTFYVHGITYLTDISCARLRNAS